MDKEKEIEAKRMRKEATENYRRIERKSDL